MAKQTPAAAPAAATGGTPPTGGTPTSTGEPLLDQFSQTMWDVFKIKLDPGTVAGLLDPAIDKLVRSNVASVRNWLRPGNPLLHPVMNYGLGVLSGRIDAVAEKRAEPLKTTLRKVSDYLDGFRSELFGKSAVEEKILATEKEKIDPRLLKALALLDAKFARDAAEFILNAPKDTSPAGMKAINEMLSQRMETWARQRDLLLHGPEKKPEPPKAKVPFRERMDRFNDVMEEELGPAVQHLEKKIEKMNAGTKARQDKQRQEAAAKQPSRMDKLLKRLARVLF